MIMIVFIQTSLAIIALFSVIPLECQDSAREKLFHIVASSHDPCPRLPCVTLSQFAANSNVYLDSNNTLIFQPGNHSLNQELSVVNVSALLMISDPAVHADASITIMQLAKIHLRSINLVHIRALNFIGIGGNVIESVDQFFFKESSFTGYEKMVGTALEIVETNAVISRSCFHSNWFGSCKNIVSIESDCYNVGGAIIANRSNLVINESEFQGNRARMGGAIFVSGHVNSMSIDDNGHDEWHGALYTETVSHPLIITGSKFCNNHAEEYGGAIFDNTSYSIEISKSQFTNNSSSNGGAISKSYNSLTIEESKFDNNSAIGSYGNGGALAISIPHTVIIVTTTFINNIASGAGGAVHVAGEFDSETKLNSVLSVYNSDFTHNLISTTSGDGAALSVWYIYSINIVESEFSENGIINDGDINCHSAPKTLRLGVEFMYIFMSTAIFNNTFSSNNKGSLSAIKGSVTFIGDTTFLANCGSCTDGGAITSYRSHLLIYGNFILKNNYARSGGAMHMIESIVYIYGQAVVVNNSANNSGGGLYLYQSRLDCKSNGTLNIIGNNASDKGGGIHAISSTIVLNVLRPGTLLIGQNSANMGGGLYFEMNTLLYILLYFKESPPVYAPIIARNRANYGGAIYMADFETCTALSQSTIKQCFLQVESVYLDKPTSRVILNVSENYAEAAGSAVYGGLLDRCTVNPWYEPVTDLVHIANITNIQNLSSVSSEPVGICFCRDGNKDCNYQPNTVRVMKGEAFTLSLVAVDQVNRTIKAYICSHLSTEIGGLGVDQLNRSIDDKCTNFIYNAYSPHATGQLNMYADGPCKDTAQSVRRVHIIFSSCKCPIGFQPLSAEENHTSCECVCDSRLRPHITECDNQTKLLKRNGNFWITYLNETANKSSGGFLIYSNCPLDYCKPPTPVLNFSLRTQDDIDEQCADNRSGMLCGTCLPNFSLSLGSSRCIQCPSNWPQTTALIIIAALLAGIALVALLLILNLTVAVGTLNGIIFYANVMYATSNTFFPYSTQNFLTIFIAWLNLDIGFDSCFYKGMDTYWKTLLHLAFPVYVIFVVVMVIFISECSTRFAQLIGRKNPVAMLATLILLSYTKLLRIIIASLSFAVLEYPDGSHKVVWLPDATVEYLKGKHIFLFILAILIFLTGTFFTLILLFWQCLIQFQNKVIFRWTRYQKLRLFLEPYHAPYDFKHRYWTGLLLLVRSALYLVISVSHNPNINTLVVVISVMFLLLILPKICYSISGHLYRNFILNLLELVVYMNLVLFSIIKLYALGLKSVEIEIVVAYISGSVIFTLSVTVLVYHIFSEIIAKTKVWKKIADKCHWRRNRTVFQESIIDDEHSNQLSRSIPTFSEIGRPSSKEKPLSALIESETEGDTNSTDMESQHGQKLEIRLERHSSSSDESVDSSTAALLGEEDQEIHNNI